jgi:hypothetical protein
MTYKSHKSFLFDNNLDETPALPNSENPVRLEVASGMSAMSKQDIELPS